MMLPIYVLMAVVGDKISAGNPATGQRRKHTAPIPLHTLLRIGVPDLDTVSKKRIPAGIPPGCSFLEIDYNQS
jgi:hypothetical protein